MDKHTKGPWVRTGTWIGDADGETIGYASSHRNDRPRPAEELEANTELMRSAPAMYDAIQALLKDWDADVFSQYTTPHPALRRHIQALRDALPED